MSKAAVLHLFGWDRKFFLPFRDFIHEHFTDGQHRFIVYGDVTEKDFATSPDTSIFPNILKNAIKLSGEMIRAKKIIIHGLFDSQLFYVLALQPWLLKKCCWVIWGGDLYVHRVKIKDWRWRKNELFRRFIVRRFGHFATYIKGDFELAQRWYGARGKHHHCLMYPSNLYTEPNFPENQSETINILVGNSADPTNNHVEIFQKLTKYKDKRIHIFCPLSYGSEVNAERITALGKTLFGGKFTPLRDFMSIDKYRELLGKIDIAVFAHERQQAMGNTITLLGLGKKVFMRSDITPWEMFEELGVKIYDVRYLNITPLESDLKKMNRARVEKCFSETALKEQLGKVFEG